MPTEVLLNDDCRLFCLEVAFTYPVPTPDSLNYDHLCREEVPPFRLERLENRVSQEDFRFPDLPLRLWDFETLQYESYGFLVVVGKFCLSKTAVLLQELSGGNMDRISLENKKLKEEIIMAGYGSDLEGYRSDLFLFKYLFPYPDNVKHARVSQL